MSAIVNVVRILGGGHRIAALRDILMEGSQVDFPVYHTFKMHIVDCCNDALSMLYLSHKLNESMTKNVECFLSLFDASSFPDCSRKFV